MAKSSNQKLKLLHLMRLFLTQTDEAHGLTMAEIIALLAQQGIAAERKSIYDDLETLRLFGLDILCERAQGNRSVYFLATRQFELPELKLLVDAVQASRFITRRKSMELIQKMESLCSVHEAQQLRRQVYVANRIKTMNESIYYNVDQIHAAISTGHQIFFQYFEWTPQKTKQLRHGGQRYQVSPWALTWDDENYYMIGYDTAAQDIRHYRVDKMLQIEVTDIGREGQDRFDRFDMGIYSKKVFGMYGGAEEQVTLQVSNHLAGVMIDRFGEDVFLVPCSQDSFSVTVSAIISPIFLGWVCSFGKDVKITAPDRVAKQLQQHVRELLQQYE